MKRPKRIISISVFLLSLLILPFSCTDEVTESSTLNGITITSLNAEIPLNLSKSQNGEWKLQNEEDAKLFFKRTFPEISERVSLVENFEIRIDPATRTVASVSAMMYDESGKNVPVGFNIEPIEHRSRFVSMLKSMFNRNGKRTTLHASFSTVSSNAPRNNFKADATFSLVVTHTCTGDPCKCCYFAYDATGKIIGCGCNTIGVCAGGVKCNHKINSQ